MSGRLDGKAALITGGNAGIGRASAILLASEGARVLITGRNGERAGQVVREIKEAGGEATFAVCDVRIADQCRAVIDKVIERYGRIDILFNNAGVLFPKTVPDCSEKEWDLTIDTSLKGAFLMSKYALPSMIDRGSGVIIHCSSGWGIQGGDKSAAYCAAKGGLVVMTKAMAIDHGPQGIRVNCVCPGDVLTPMLADEAKQRGISWDTFLETAADRPLGRVGTAEDIARAVLFLSTDDSSFMTGTALVVDGGGGAG